MSSYYLQQKDSIKTHNHSTTIMGANQSLSRQDSTACLPAVQLTDSVAEPILITEQPPVMAISSNKLLSVSRFTTDQLRAYQRAYELSKEKCIRMVSYHVTQARLLGKSEFIKTLYVKCIDACIPPEHHAPELGRKWLYRVLTMIQSEFPDIQIKPISCGQEYLTIRFRV